MNQKLKLAYQSLDWVYEQISDLNQRINDYIFFSGCDIKLKSADVVQLKAFSIECDELMARYLKDLRTIEKLAGKEE